jgi:hypothetical protein
MKREILETARSGVGRFPRTIPVLMTYANVLPRCQLYADYFWERLYV